jgi:nitrite reductase (cytochrome c-552)
MPYTNIGSSKVSSHVWQSPLNSIEVSCGQCHREGPQWLEQRVETIQAQVIQSQDLAANAVVEAINELKLSRGTPTANQAKLQEAMLLHRKAQWYLDYVIVTNSYGFHNPTATYLHSRRTIGWRGRKSAWLVVIGFLVVLFTLFGVSILLPGLHSYA